MVSQIENDIIKKKLTCAIVFGILYFVCALWLVWWKNITGKSFLLFIGFLYTAFSAVSLSSKKKMIISDFILFALISRLLLKYIPRFFLTGEPYILIFYLFIISIPVVHIFCLLHPFLNRYFVFDKQEIQEIDKIMQFRRIVITILIFILFLLGSLAIFGNKIIKTPTLDKHPIPLKNIQFLLEGDLIIAKPSISIPWQDVYFRNASFETFDNKNRWLTVLSLGHYDLKSGIIYDRSFVKSPVGGGYFRIGKGEIINGKFKATFPEGTKFLLLIDAPLMDFGKKDAMLIKLPYSFEELKLKQDEL